MMIGHGTTVKAKKDSECTKHWLISYKANLNKMALVHRFGPQALLVHLQLQAPPAIPQVFLGSGLSASSLQSGLSASSLQSVPANHRSHLTYCVCHFATKLRIKPSLLS